MEYKYILSHIKILIQEEYLVTMFIAIHYFLILIFSSLLPLIIIYSCVKVNAFIIIWPLYYLWIYYDSTTLKTKGRKFHRLKYLLSFENVRNYFPTRLVKTADIPPKCNYIFVCHPHGIVPHGILSNLLSEVNKFTELFPNIDVRLATLKVLFMIPICREYAMAGGFCTSDEDNLKYLLNGKPCKAVILFPGGINEFLLCHPGAECKIFAQRKGFVRIALQTGAPLVPVFTFGEQNTQNIVEIKYRLAQYLNNIIHKLTYLKFAAIQGRGIFQNRFGLLPHRRPLTTVVGKPIQVPKIEDPSDELIDKYHKKFYKALHNLFESNKHLHDEAGTSARLTMI